jgi:hypothetical protein
MMDRRNFIRSSAALAGGALLLGGGSLLASEDPGASGVAYSEAKAGTAAARQAYLDQALKAGDVKFVGSLPYFESPKDLFIQSLTGNGFTQKDAEKLYKDGGYAKSYSRTLYTYQNIGSGKKPDVAIFPLPFSRYKENEFSMFLYNGDEFCKSVCEGLYVEDTRFESSLINPLLVQDLMLLKADYETLEKLANAKQSDPQFRSKYGDTFFQDYANKYIVTYADIRNTMAKEDHTAYEMEAAATYLDVLSRWAPAGLRYHKPTRPFDPKIDTIQQPNPGLIA